MSELHPKDLNDMHDVTRYWRYCVGLLDTTDDDKRVASGMVGVVTNPKDQEWGSSATGHPAYPIISDLAADLELPEGSDELRERRWRCIKALLPVLEADYPPD